MKNFMVANVQKKGRFSPGMTVNALIAQIENSLELGWRAKDIMVLSNFDFYYRGVKTYQIDLNEFCLTGSKMFGLKWLFDRKQIDDVIWSHDLDAWQNVWFDQPEMKDVAAGQYSRPKFNGGSIFWTPQCRDIVNEIVKIISKHEYKKEEPTINKVFKSKKFKDRVTTLDYSYNVGCSGFLERFILGEKPIKVAHFHPHRGLAWETFALDKHGIDEIPMTDRLIKLLLKYYPGRPKKLSAKSEKYKGQFKEKIENLRKKSKK